MDACRKGVSICCGSLLHPFAAERLGPPSYTCYTENVCASHAHCQNLRTLLKITMPLTSIKQFMPWPLIVLDREAVNGAVAMHPFVQMATARAEQGHRHDCAIDSKNCF